MDEDLIISVINNELGARLASTDKPNGHKNVECKNISL